MKETRLGSSYKLFNSPSNTGVFRQSCLWCPIKKLARFAGAFEHALELASFQLRKNTASSHSQERWSLSHVILFITLEISKKANFNESCWNELKSNSFCKAISSRTAHIMHGFPTEVSFDIFTLSLIVFVFVFLLFVFCHFCALLSLLKLLCSF